jgi:hypothetical protein
MSEAPRLFVVARVAWAVEPWDDKYTRFHPDTLNTSAAVDRRFVPVAAFAARGAAEARMRELELEAARVFNPFWGLGPLIALTRLPPAEFIARLAALVAPLPADSARLDSSNRPVWRLWWDEQMPGWSDTVLTAVWDLFDAVRFYAVLEVEAE